MCFREIERTVAILVGCLELLTQVVATVAVPVSPRGLHLGRCQLAVLVAVQARKPLAMRGDALSASAREILPSLSVSAAFQWSPCVIAGVGETRQQQSGQGEERGAVHVEPRVALEVPATTRHYRAR
jgi:hypothetical protein